MNRSLSAKSTAKFDSRVNDWISFLDKKGYDDADNYVLSEYQHDTRVKLLILFIISLEETGVNPKNHVAAIRTHFQRHFGSQEMFSDWSLALARKQVETGRELSLKMEDRLRIPTPFVFMGYMRKAFFLAGLKENNVALMLVYLGNVLCYDRCMRASEVAMSSSKITHAIRVMDAFIEYQKEDGSVGRWMPWDLNSKTFLICCTVAEAKAARPTGRGATKYFALKTGSTSVRGVYPSREAVIAASTGQLTPVWRVFTNRAKAYVYSDEDSIPQIDKDTSSVLALHLLNRSAKARRNGTIRRIVYRVSSPRADGTIDAESQIVLDLLHFFKLAGFSESDGELPMLSRWGEGLQLKRLTRDMMAQGLKEAACHFDLDPRFFATHSNRISHASTLMNAGFAEDDIQKFCDWAGESSRRYEVAFNARPSAMRLAEEGAAMPLADAKSMVPPRFWKEPRPPLVLRLNLKKSSAQRSSAVLSAAPSSGDSLRHHENFGEAECRQVELAQGTHPTARPHPHTVGLVHAASFQIPTAPLCRDSLLLPEPSLPLLAVDVCSVTSSRSSSSPRKKKTRSSRRQTQRPPVDSALEDSFVPMTVSDHKLPMYLRHSVVLPDGNVEVQLSEDLSPVFIGDVYSELELALNDGRKVKVNVRPVGWKR
jgi:hypothetical protein